MFQDDAFEELVTDLTSMRASSEKYFPEEQNTKMKLNSWIHNPFLPNLQKPESMSNETYESLLEMSSDTIITHHSLRNPVAAVAEWYRYRTVACFVTGSSPVPLKTRRVGQRCTLNLSRAETSSRWCGVVVREGASSGVVHVT
ncbi:zinc finger BED domain-containing protein 5 [Trichonephila clavipes]|uniref:Zinc finger BED domain-containing protein 5 n=1 Tax=Trichonephila clavipes TaxID=2585209 RepID=A0A8X6RYA7_TRICX|nr:zinc finger BED domain-containing protein 5 [Trichonephila clavipes]